LTPDEIRSHPLFEKLNERQKTFVDALLRNGNDKVKAAQEAWTTNGEASARTLANRAMKSESIAFLIESYFGRDQEAVQFSREQALDFLAKKARNAKDDALALSYMKVIVEMNGWLVKAAATPPTQVRDDGQDEFTL
jgi:phage terminase small subunit